MNRIYSSLSVISAFVHSVLHALFSKKSVWRFVTVFISEPSPTKRHKSERIASVCRNVVVGKGFCFYIRAAPDETAQNERMASGCRNVFFCHPERNKKHTLVIPSVAEGSVRVYAVMVRNANCLLTALWQQILRFRFAPLRMTY